MRIRTKLVASSVIAAAGVFGLGALGLWQAGAMFSSSEALIEHDIMAPLEEEIARLSAREEAVRKLLNADRDAYQVLVAERFIIAGEGDVQAHTTDHADNLDQIRDRVNAAFEGSGADLQSTKPAFDAAYAEWRSLTEQAVADPTSSTNDQRVAAFDAVRTMIDDHSGALEAEVSEAFERIAAIRADVDALRVEAGQRQFVLGALAAVVGLAVVAALLPIAWSINARMRRMADRMEDVAVGNADLTKRVDDRGSDEIAALGKWFNAVVERFGSIVAQVSEAAASVDQSTKTIQHQTESASDSATDQARGLSQVSAAITQMSQSVEEVARSTNEASTSAKKSSTLARSGGETVKRTVDGMQAIDEAVSNSSASVSALGERGREIGLIIEVINEIADQTNLLALNAAIEAARAGEHGRGFAVVADEVRKLADRTTTATEQISESITSIQTETDTAVARITEGSEQTRLGAELAAEAGESLDEIEKVTAEVARVMENIAAATEQQSGAAGEITDQASQVAASAESINDAMRNTSREAGALATASQQLIAIVEPFKTE